MNQAIGDRAAIKFAVGFYDGLGAGRDYAAAFELGLTGIDLEGIAQVHIPVLLGPGGNLGGGSARVQPESEPLTPQISGSASGVNLGFQGAGAQVFISYRSQDPDRHLAEVLQAGVQAAGHRAFMAGESIRLGEDWVRRIDAELAGCEYFLLLLSERSALRIVDLIKPEERRKASILKKSLSFCRDATLPY